MDQNTHKKIVSIIKIRGPSLPIQLSKELGMSSLFVSAFLAELAQEKTIKVSHLKVGGSPLYFVDGQEEMLEKFYKFLHPKEAETFLLIKRKKLLKDADQKPPIRVALRSIRDFAMGFKKDNEIYWRFHSTPESEIMSLLTKVKEKPAEKPAKQKPKIQPKPMAKPTKPKISTKQAVEMLIKEFQNPLLTETKPKKQKPKSEFVQKIIGFLNNNNIRIVEEKDYKPKEYNCVIQITSILGPINFLTQAKNKKTISEIDLKKLLSEAQKIPLSALMIHNGRLSKKAEQYAQKYFSILKVIKIG